MAVSSVLFHAWSSTFCFNISCVEDEPLRRYSEHQDVVESISFCQKSPNFASVRTPSFKIRNHTFHCSINSFIVQVFFYTFFALSFTRYHCRYQLMATCVYGTVVLLHFAVV